MTAADLLPMSQHITWYRPEFPDGAERQWCYCNKPAFGRTTFWNGYKATSRWQCRKHLPVDAVCRRAVPS